MKNHYLYIIIGLALLLLPGLLAAYDGFPQRIIEVNASYDYLKPTEDNESWKSMGLKYNHKFNAENTMLVNIGGSVRDESFAWLQTALYRDWLPRFYTYTSVGASTKTRWMGKIRIDNDFNYKMGNELQYILTLGQTVILYDDDRKDFLFSVGGIYYLPHIVADARYFFNKSDPGNVWSNTLQMSLSGGTMGKYWLTLLGSTGAQSYQSVNSDLPIDQKVTSIGLNQQIWIQSEYGLKIGLGYLKVEDGYEKFNATIGYFYQFP